MPWKPGSPVFDPRLRGLCVSPYPGHPKGCPNFGTKRGCPPRAPLLPEHFDLTRTTYLIWSRFDLRSHVTRMRALHPEWSNRQLTCCLYWQGTARKALELEIGAFLIGHSLYSVERCPEAMGMNVTESMKKIGEELEWPPVDQVVHVALGARKKE